MGAGNITPSSIIRIPLPVNTGNVSEKDIVDYVAKQLRQELKAVPDRVPGAHRRVTTLGINEREAVYEAQYHVNAAIDSH